MSLLNLLLSGVTANHRPESSQLVGQADASQPQHPALPLGSQEMGLCAALLGQCLGMGTPSQQAGCHPLLCVPLVPK